ncbi:hypothetical protein N9901_02715 [Flavobacteriaceae bacterium]|nr:hypothetical protein [Flavobacteriaceae bacterium]
MNLNILKNNKSILLPLFVAIVWMPILIFDSKYFESNYFDGGFITNIIVIFITLYLIWAVPLRLKILMIIMIPFSWFGEYIFCVILKMYHYRGATIPLYVPFGHAGVFAVGWLFTQRSIATSNPEKFKRISIWFYIISFSFVIFYLKDNLAIILGILFFLTLKRKKFLPFYLMMGFVVLYLELVGTYLGAWTWHRKQGIFTTTNPPIGIIFFYIGADILLGKITKLLLKARRKLKRRLQLATD